jgi:hypothetical protein
MSAKQSDRDYEIAWLKDHGPYELCMMRYGLARMKTAIDQLEYNAFFECFCVKARSLVDFLTRRRANNTNFDAKDFDENYSAPPRQHVQSVINRLDDHVVHAGAKRPMTSEGKITLEECNELSEWIELAMSQFLKGMPEKNQDLWDEKRAAIPTTIIFVGSAISASSADPQSSTTASLAGNAYSAEVKGPTLPDN